MTHAKLTLASSVLLAFIAAPGCRTKGTVGTHAEVDARPDAEVDVRPDAEVDVRPDAEVDASPDAEVDVRPDAEVDASPDAEADTESDARSDGPIEDISTDGPIDVPPTPSIPEPPVDASPPGMPSGSACLTPGDCTSHFCVDSVCCDSACTGQCHSCDQAVARGTCLPFYGGVDEVAIPPCLGVRTCSVDPAFASSCALVDGQECDRDTDCASRHCRTYYVDHDSDGYGAAQGAIRRCDATANPPAPYINQGGDCCDLDPAANPAVPPTSYFLTANACGSFDWNCSGIAEPQQARTCPFVTSLTCGQKCLGPFSVLLFTQSCH